MKYSMWPFWLKVAFGILNVVLAGVAWFAWRRVEDARRWMLWGIAGSGLFSKQPTTESQYTS